MSAVELISGRSVVVIGSGGELNQSDYSALVGSVDTVVRVNPRADSSGLILSPVQRRHTTGRLDLAYHCGTAAGESVIGVRKTLVPLSAFSSLTPGTLAALAQSGCRGVVVPPHRYAAAQTRCKALRRVCPVLPYHGSYPAGHKCPTTGLGAIHDILRLEPRELYILGFDCYCGTTPYVDGHAEAAMPRGSDRRDFVPSRETTGVGPHDFLKELASLYEICISNAATVRITGHLREVLRSKGYDTSSLRVIQSLLK